MGISAIGYSAPEAGNEVGTGQDMVRALFPHGASELLLIDLLFVFGMIGFAGFVTRAV